MEPAPLKRLGRYDLVRHLASGGMADVLIARASGIEGFERHVVLKRIKPERAKDPRFIQMFLDEARLAGSLHHRNIVQVHDIGQEQGEYFFAMEYVHGEDVRKILYEVSRRGGQVPLDHVLTIIIGAAAGLHHAHEHCGPDRKPLGIVHRDVSPGNILVGYDGTVKVADFGIAKATYRELETRSGVMKGKVAYMSPEQCVGQPVDRRGDVYSLGICLYELATVRRLFKGANDFLTMSSIAHGVIPRPSELRPDLPIALEAVILKALAPVPANRYQTADELRAALEDLAGSLGLQTTPTGLAAYMKSLFGDRVVPWLDDDDEPEIELSIDFDGSAEGVVHAPVEAIQRLEIPEGLAAPGSPLVKARTRAITGSPPAGAPADGDAVIIAAPVPVDTGLAPGERPAAPPDERAVTLRDEPGATAVGDVTATIKIDVAAAERAATDVDPPAKRGKELSGPGHATVTEIVHIPLDFPNRGRRRLPWKVIGAGGAVAAIVFAGLALVVASSRTSVHEIKHPDPPTEGLPPAPATPDPASTEPPADTTRATAPTPTPAVPEVAPPAPAVTPDPARPVPDEDPETGDEPSVAVEEPADPQTTDRGGKPDKGHRSKSKHRSRKPTTGTWDPDTLFPTTKKP